MKSVVVTQSELRDSPPLSNGDRLTRDEFERRYEGMPEIKKAELIEGVVVMGSPLRFSSHAEPHARIVTWLGVYQASTPGVALGDNPTVRLDLDNEPQPDAILRIREGGSSFLTQKDYVEGSPELVVEIAASTAAIDLGDKKQAYRRNRIPEYLIWQVVEQKLDWFRWVEGDYISLDPDGEGICRSQIFPGLWLAVPPLLSGDLSQVLTVLQQGIRSAEHQAFVDQLGSLNPLR